MSGQDEWVYQTIAQGYCGGVPEVDAGHLETLLAELDEARTFDTYEGYLHYRAVLDELAALGSVTLPEPVASEAAWLANDPVYEFAWSPVDVIEQVRIPVLAVWASGTPSSIRSGVPTPTSMRWNRRGTRTTGLRSSRALNHLLAPSETGCMSERSQTLKRVSGEQGFAVKDLNALSALDPQDPLRFKLLSAWPCAAFVRAHEPGVPDHIEQDDCRQSSVVPPEWEEQLDRLQSDVPPFETEQVRTIIREELGAFPEEIYASFDPQPLAAASTAQVHRATLASGEQVVVKVQRPFIYNQMKADIGIMQNATRALSSRSQALRAIDLEGMLEQFGESVLSELDYNIEAYNAHRLAQNMAKIPGIHFPTVYPQLSTGRVITMEFVHGVKITNLEAIDQASLDRATLAKNTMRH